MIRGIKLGSLRITRIIAGVSTNAKALLINIKKGQWAEFIMPVPHVLCKFAGKVALIRVRYFWLLFNMI